MIIFFNYLCQSIYVHMVDLGWLETMLKRTLGGALGGALRG